MKKLLILFLVAITFSCAKAQSNSESETTVVSNTKQETTTYYLIRHAEKDSKPANNPKLLPSGKIRAKNYASYFKGIDLDAVYSTNFTRTKNTAAPTANSKNLKPIIYSPSRIDYKAFLEETKGKSVLIVGHSNTIPGFVNAIIVEEKYDEINESVYNTLFIVKIKNGEIIVTQTTLN